MKINRKFFLYFAYSLEILILYVLQGTPNLIPEILGSKPLLLIPAALSIAGKENKIPSLIFGAVCGVLTDIATGGSIGFFAILLTVICYAEAHIFKTYFSPNFISVSIISVIAVPVLIGLYFLIFTVFSGVPDSKVLFVNHYISRIIYTFVMIFPLYFLNGFLYKNLNNLNNKL